MVFLSQEKEQSKLALNDNVEKVRVDTVYISAEQEVRIEKVVEKVEIAERDTVMLLTQMNQSDNEEYLVLRDRLLQTQKIKIQKDFAPATNNATDKLIDKMSSDDFFSDVLIVEFWESPIDYQGYRMNKTKLILFGVNPNESFILRENEPGKITMTSGEFSAILQATEKYRSFNFQ